LNLSYNYQKGPNVIVSEKQAVKEGINCIGLMHLLLKKLFNRTVPDNLRVLEIFHENPYFQTINTLKTIQMGDILFLGKIEISAYIYAYKPIFDRNKHLSNEQEGRNIIGKKYAGFHTAMFTGDRDIQGDPLIIDIQKETNKVRIWSLNELMSKEKYRKLYKIKRIII
jgi:hypothetical protein